MLALDDPPSSFLFFADPTACTRLWCEKRMHLQGDNTRGRQERSETRKLALTHPTTRDENALFAFCAPKLGEALRVELNVS